MADVPENTDPRNDDQILSGEIPGHDSVTLGGLKYPLQEPTNKRARGIRQAFAQYDRARVDLAPDDPAQMDLMEEFLDRALQQFTPEIEADWPRIEETATDTERLAVMAIMRDVVVLPFLVAAEKQKAQAGPPKSRAQRRKK